MLKHLILRSPQGRGAKSFPRKDLVPRARHAVVAEAKGQGNPAMRVFKQLQELWKRWTDPAERVRREEERKTKEMAKRLEENQRRQNG